MSTGLTPYYINCGSEPVLPIELGIPTWQILPWSEVHYTADLLAMRARQLQRQDKDLEEATLHLQRICLEKKERHDLKHGICEEELAAGSTVLLYDTRRKKDMSRKLAFKWLGLYRISDAVRDKGTYMLEEIDGSRCKKLTQRTVSTIHQAARSKAALQLVQESVYLAGCQRAVHQLIRGCKSACPRGCALTFPKASPQGIFRLFTRYYLCNMGCLQGICVSCPRADISVDK